MDHELKQRLIGAVVVTALCAIFIPMLFDDPVDNSGKLVSELNIPAPVDPDTDLAGKLPSNAEQALKPSAPEPLSTEAAGDTLESTGAAEELPEEAEKQNGSGESLYAESEGYTREDANTEEVVEQPIAEPEEGQPKPRLKQAPTEQSLSSETADGVRKSIASKTPVRDTRVEAMAQEPVKVKKIAEPVKPVIVKKFESEPLIANKDAVAKASAFADTAKQPAIKQPNSAKSLAAAIAEAKKPTVVPKASPKLVRWYIQIGSFSKRENAMSLWDSLREQGLPASLDTVQTDKGTSYRLRVGPELDGKKAAAMKLRLDRQNIKAILISE
ncbi:MAG TPA: SPOR domain-containing protein [Methylobacter sp.]|jgi:DedD protein